MRLEAGTVQALREHRAAAAPLIAKHGGRIVKKTGDGCGIVHSHSFEYPPHSTLPGPLSHAPYAAQYAVLTASAARIPTWSMRPLWPNTWRSGRPEISP